MTGSSLLITYQETPGSMVDVDMQVGQLTPVITRLEPTSYVSAKLTS